MGGIIILISAVITTLVWVKFNIYVCMVLFSILGMGSIGILDDLTKVIKARSLGLTARQKLLGQTFVGLVIALVMRYHDGLKIALPMDSTDLGNMMAVPSTVCQIPLLGLVDLGYLYIPLVITVIVGATNAVNLTDGLDGLASGVMAVSIIPFLFFAYVCGHIVFAKHLGVLYISGINELAVICAALFGGCLGFLWFNGHPAEVFMGDTGSLALGGAICSIAVCTRTEFFLALIGGIFVSEALSVFIQVGYFKWSHGKRIFRMSPIHHHFELCGWPEEKVVIRFWIASLILSLSGFALFASHLIWK